MNDVLKIKWVMVERNQFVFFFSCISSPFIFLFSIPIPKTQVLEDRTGTPPPSDLDPRGSWRFFERNSFIGMFTACFIQNICKLIENKRFILKKLSLYATGGGSDWKIIQKCKLKWEKMTSPLKYIYKETIRILNFRYTPFIYIL